MINMKSVLVQAKAKPSLLSHIQYDLCREDDIITVLDILASNKLSPPEVYLDFCYSYLRKNPAYSPYRRLIHSLEFSSLRNFYKSIYKVKFPSTHLQFTSDQNIDILSHASLLKDEPEYKDTSEALIAEISDKLILKSLCLDLSQCMSLMDITQRASDIPEAATLSKICNARVQTEERLESNDHS